MSAIVGKLTTHDAEMKDYVCRGEGRVEDKPFWRRAQGVFVTSPSPCAHGHTDVTLCLAGHADPPATRERASAGHQQPARSVKTGPTKPSKYACPDCAVRFGVYSRCLAHLIATGHANPDNRKGLQQRCAAAAQAVRPQLKPQLSTSQGVGAISTQTADGAKAVHIMRGLASDFRGRVWPKSKHELRVAAKNTSEKDTGVLHNDDVATMCSLWKAAGYRLIPASIPGTERCLGLCSHF